MYLWYRGRNILTSLNGRSTLQNCKVTLWEDVDDGSSTLAQRSVIPFIIQALLRRTMSNMTRR